MLSRYALRYGKVELNEAAEECSELSFECRFPRFYESSSVFSMGASSLATIDGNSRPFRC